MNRTALTRPANVTPELSIGQRVTVYGSFGAPDMDGTVVKLPRLAGLLHDPFVTVEADHMGPVRAVDPRRVAPVPTCDSCEHGCECDGALGQLDCGHYACWGRARVHRGPQCPDADVMRARRVARSFSRAAGSVAR